MAAISSEPLSSSDWVNASTYVLDTGVGALDASRVHRDTAGQRLLFVPATDGIGQTRSETCCLEIGCTWFFLSSEKSDLLKVDEE